MSGYQFPRRTGVIQANPLPDTIAGPELSGEHFGKDNARLMAQFGNVLGRAGDVADAFALKADIAVVRDAMTKSQEAWQNDRQTLPSFKGADSEKAVSFAKEKMDSYRRDYGKSINNNRRKALFDGQFKAFAGSGMAEADIYHRSEMERYNIASLDNRLTTSMTEIGVEPWNYDKNARYAQMAYADIDATLPEDQRIPRKTKFAVDMCNISVDSLIAMDKYAEAEEYLKNRPESSILPEEHVQSQLAKIERKRQEHAQKEMLVHSEMIGKSAAQSSNPEEIIASSGLSEEWRDAARNVASITRFNEQRALAASRTQQAMNAARVFKKSMYQEVPEYFSADQKKEMIRKGAAELYQQKSTEPDYALLVKIDGMSRNEAMEYFLDDAKRDELVKASGGWDAPILAAITGKVLGLDVSDPDAKMRLEDNVRLSRQHPNSESMANANMLNEYNSKIERHMSNKGYKSYSDIPAAEKNEIAAEALYLDTISSGISKDVYRRMLYTIDPRFGEVLAEYPDVDVIQTMIDHENIPPYMALKRLRNDPNLKGMYSAIALQEEYGSIPGSGPVDSAKSLYANEGSNQNDSLIPRDEPVSNDYRPALGPTDESPESIRKIVNQSEYQFNGKSNEGMVNKSMYKTFYSMSDGTTIEEVPHSRRSWRNGISYQNGEDYHVNKGDVAYTIYGSGRTFSMPLGNGKTAIGVKAEHLDTIAESFKPLPNYAIIKRAQELGIEPKFYPLSETRGVWSFEKKFDEKGDLTDCEDYSIDGNPIAIPNFAMDQHSKIVISSNIFLEEQLPKIKIWDAHYKGDIPEGSQDAFEAMQKVAGTKGTYIAKYVVVDDDVLQAVSPFAQGDQKTDIEYYSIFAAMNPENALMEMYRRISKSDTLTGKDREQADMAVNALTKSLGITVHPGMILAVAKISGYDFNDLARIAAEPNGEARLKKIAEDSVNNFDPSKPLIAFDEKRLDALQSKSESLYETQEVNLGLRNSILHAAKGMGKEAVGSVVGVGDSLAEAGAGTGNYFIKQTLKEIRHLKDLEERRLRGEAVEPEKSLATFFGEYHSLIQAYDASALRKINDEIDNGDDLKSWKALEDVYESMLQDSEYHVARASQNTQNTSDTYAYERSDSKAAHYFEVGIKVVGQAALYTILAKVKGAQVAWQAISMGSDFLDNYNSFIKDGDDPGIAFIKSGGLTAYGFGKDKLIDYGFGKVISTKSPEELEKMVDSGAKLWETGKSAAVSFAQDSTSDLAKSYNPIMIR